MAIDDPTALPENAQQTAEYLREADLAFDREQLDEAKTLYWSASSAGLFPSDESRNHAYLRVGIILMGQGNNDDAYRWLEAAGPAGADMLRVIDAGTPDASVDPDVIPETPEMLGRYMNAATAANDSKDYATFDGLMARIMDSTAMTPGERSHACVVMAQSLLDRGLNVQAEEWAREALAQSSGATEAEARRLIALASDQLTVDEMGNENRGITYGFELAAAINIFEGGMADKGKATFERVVADTTGLNDDEAKGRARYYLGVIAYQEHDFDVAREHLEFALAHAADPEMGYASEALRWRYQEEG